MKDYYDILGVKHDDNLETIKRAFRQKAIKYHPDKHFGDKYFNDKFIDVKEAYDVLSDNDKKHSYDNELRKSMPSNQTNSFNQKREEAKEEEEKINEKFQYDPYKAFYSSQDRYQQNTQAVSPIIDFWGDKISEEMEFFCFPKHVGKIVCGFTTLKKTDNPRTGFLSGLTNLTFLHNCSFIGINGFAEAEMYKNREQKAFKYEINFNEVKGVLVNITQNYRNFVYTNTSYSYLWFNKNGDLIRQIESTYTNKNGNPEKYVSDFWTNNLAERYWSVYLLDMMENELRVNGYIDFYLVVLDKNKFVTVKFIELGIGYLKVIYSNRETRYNFNEIKQIQGLFIKKDGDSKN
jgi:curved DNA-binding protein CbpA